VTGAENPPRDHKHEAERQESAEQSARVFPEGVKERSCQGQDGKQAKDAGIRIGGLQEIATVERTEYLPEREIQLPEHRDVYHEAFHLNDTELDLINGLVPPGQMLIRKAQSSKKIHLNVDSVSHWMATNNPRDNLKKREYFDRHGFADGLRHLAEEWPFQPRGLAASAPSRSC